MPAQQVPILVSFSLCISFSFLNLTLCLFEGQCTYVGQASYLLGSESRPFFSFFTITHWRQESFLVACKTYTKPSTFVKYVIKLVGTANPIANSKFVEQYVMNNKANQIF